MTLAVDITTKLYKDLLLIVLTCILYDNQL